MEDYEELYLALISHNIDKVLEIIERIGPDAFNEPVEVYDPDYDFNRGYNNEYDQEYNSNHMREVDFEKIVWERYSDYPQFGLVIIKLLEMGFQFEYWSPMDEAFRHDDINVLLAVAKFDTLAYNWLDHVLTYETEYHPVAIELLKRGMTIPDIWQYFNEKNLQNYADENLVLAIINSGAPYDPIIETFDDEEFDKIFTINYPEFQKKVPLFPEYEKYLSDRKRKIVAQMKLNLLAKGIYLAPELQYEIIINL